MSAASRSGQSWGRIRAADSPCPAAAAPSRSRSTLPPVGSGATDPDIAARQSQPLTGNPLTLEPWEIATHTLFGGVPHRAVPAAAGDGPVAALEDAIRPALARPPCLVSFSGGRDSSVVLAVATALARREGLPEPIPSTLRFPSVPSTDETRWQEEVVRHLRLRDWQRRGIADELDLVGPVAAAVLRRRGLLFPAQAYFHAPLLGDARGGTLLTGAGGNEILYPSVATRLAGRPLDRAAWRQLAFLAAPQAVRVHVGARRRAGARFVWLRPDAQRELTRRWSAESGEPVRWRARLPWTASRRWLAALRSSLGWIAEDQGADVIHPLVDDGFVSALSALPRRGRRTRTEIMRTLFRHLLPDALLARSGQTSFGGVYWGAHTRDFIAGWPGTGLDPEIVDIEILRRLWERPVPQMATAMLVQSAWLASDRAAARQLSPPRGG